MRTIKIVQTATASVNRFDSDATTWGELADQIKGEYNLDKVKATVKETKGTLEHHDAVLPEGEFTIFLRAAKNKAGGKNEFSSMSFKELRAWVKEHPEVKDYFKKNPIEGRNWTQWSVEELANTINNFVNKEGESSVHAESTNKNAADVVESVKESKKETAEPAKKEEVEEVQAEEVEETATKDTPRTAVESNQSFKISDLSTEQKLDTISLLADAIREDFEDGESVLNVKSKHTRRVIGDIEEIQDSVSNIYVVLSKYVDIDNEAVKRATAKKVEEDKQKKEDKDLLAEAKEFENEL